MPLIETYADMKVDETLRTLESGKIEFFYCSFGYLLVDSDAVDLEIIAGKMFGIRGDP